MAGGGVVLGRGRPNRKYPRLGNEALPDPPVTVVAAGVGTATIAGQTSTAPSQAVLPGFSTLISQPLCDAVLIAQPLCGAALAT